MAVHGAAVEQGVKPYTKRDKKSRDENFSLSASRGGRGMSESMSDDDNQITEKMEIWAELLGRDPKDPEYRKKINKIIKDGRTSNPNIYKWKK